MGGETPIAFYTLKQTLTNEQILQFPDWNAPFKLITDACQNGIGMILAQMRDGAEHVIAYASRGLKGNEKFFSITQLEALAAVEGCKKFTRFLELQPFEVVTDHAALQWILKRSHKDPQCPRLARMALTLQGFGFTIKFRAGSKHTNADY